MFSLDGDGFFDGKGVVDILLPLVPAELPLDFRRPQALQGVAPIPADRSPVAKEGFGLVETAALQFFRCQRDGYDPVDAVEPFRPGKAVEQYPAGPALPLFAVIFDVVQDVAHGAAVIGQAVTSGEVPHCRRLVDAPGMPDSGQAGRAPVAVAGYQGPAGRTARRV